MIAQLLAPRPAGTARAGHAGAPERLQLVPRGCQAPVPPLCGLSPLIDWGPRDPHSCFPLSWVEGPAGGRKQAEAGQGGGRSGSGHQGCSGRGSSGACCPVLPTTLPLQPRNSFTAARPACSAAGASPGSPSRLGASCSAPRTQLSCRGEGRCFCRGSCPEGRAVHSGAAQARVPGLLRLRLASVCPGRRPSHV